MQHASQRRAPLLLTVLAVVLVLLPFLFWRATWFGRSLNDEEIGHYLQDEQRPRRIQHALSQISDRLASGNSTVKAWYPQIIALARHPLPEIRSTAAWVMGQDNTSEAFHQSLRALLGDPELMVRRNAALSLVRFQDASGRAELVKVLQPYYVRAPQAGVVSVPVHVSNRVGMGSLVARIKAEQGREIEIRSPFQGEIAGIVAREGSRVSAGDRILSVTPESDQVWEALRGLYGVGQPEDLPVVERYAQGATDTPARVRQQAVFTARAIRTRSERNPNR